MEIEIIFDDILSPALSTIIHKTRSFYKECSSESSLSKFFELSLIIAEFQKQIMKMLEEHIKFSEEEIKGTAFLSEIEEIRQNSFEEFLNLSKGNIAKCADLVNRVKDVEDFDKRVIDFFNEILLKHIQIIIQDFQIISPSFNEETLEMFKTETIFPLLSVCENLRQDTIISLCSMINLYYEIQIMLEKCESFMDIVHLIRSKIMGQITKIINKENPKIMAELGITEIEVISKFSQEQLEVLIKRLYEIVFKYKGYDEKFMQTENYKYYIRSLDIKKQISIQVAENILKIYEICSTLLKNYKTQIEIYDIETIKKSLI